MSRVERPARVNFTPARGEKIPLSAIVQVSQPVRKMQRKKKTLDSCSRDCGGSRQPCHLEARCTAQSDPAAIDGRRSQKAA
jgi:hypothetical protein